MSRTLPSPVSPKMSDGTSNVMGVSPTATIPAPGEYADPPRAESRLFSGEGDLLAKGDLALAEIEFVVVDLETTGWSPEQSAIAEIGAVRVRDGVRRGEFASLVNPGASVPQCIAELTGITDWLLAAAPSVTAVLPGLLRFADGCVLVAHNAPFDLGFLAAACGDSGLVWPGFTVLDTVTLARQLVDPEQVPDCRLGTLAAFFGARTSPTHRALADARATADILGSLIALLARQGVQTLGQLRTWPDVILTPSPA